MQQPAKEQVTTSSNALIDYFPHVNRLAFLKENFPDPKIRLDIN